MHESTAKMVERIQNQGVEARQWIDRAADAAEMGEAKDARAAAAVASAISADRAASIAYLQIERLEGIERTLDALISEVARQ